MDDTCVRDSVLVFACTYYRKDNRVWSLALISLCPDSDTLSWSPANPSGMPVEGRGSSLCPVSHHPHTTAQRHGQPRYLPQFQLVTTCHVPLHGAPTVHKNHWPIIISDYRYFHVLISQLRLWQWNSTKEDLLSIDYNDTAVRGLMALDLHFTTIICQQ